MPTERLQPGDVSEASARLTESAILVCEKCNAWTLHRFHEAQARIIEAAPYSRLMYRCDTCSKARQWGTWLGVLRRRGMA
jgi:hypothetical protein